MLRLFYCNGYVDVHKGGQGLAQTPRNARKWAKAFVKDQDIFKSEFWTVDEDGVEYCETFYNSQYFPNNS